MEKLQARFTEHITNALSNKCVKLVICICKYPDVQELSVYTYLSESICLSISSKLLNVTIVGVCKTVYSLKQRTRGSSDTDNRAWQVYTEVQD